MTEENRSKLIAELVRNLCSGVYGSGGYVGFAAREAAAIEKILLELFNDRST